MTDLLSQQEKQQFTPDWRSPPGDTIRDLLEDRNLPYEQLAFCLKISLPQLQNLLDGKLILSREIAEGLSRIFGVSQQFWLNREANFRFPLNPDRETNMDNSDTVCPICPSCASGAIAATEMAFPPGQEDTNEADCSDCGWAGILQNAIDAAKNAASEMSKQTKRTKRQ